MNIKITRPVQGGTIRAVVSKSQAHRLLICAALSSKESQVVCPETNNDIDATVRCLNALGADIVNDGGVFSVRPVTAPVVGERLLDVGESGATLRFMLPVACALGADAIFHMHGRLPARPLSPLYEELMAHGCALSPYGMNPLHTSGHLKSGSYTMPGNISSQFISGLMFALPLISGDSVIKITGEIESKPYVDMTIAALNKYGVIIKPGHHGYIIRGKQHYTSKETVNIEGDWSNAAFWLSAGALTACAGRGREVTDAIGDSVNTSAAGSISGAPDITVTNLNHASLQGDKSILKILERFGARVEVSKESARVKSGFLKGIDIDAGDIPDLVPILAAVASVADGKTTIYNAGRLRAKESDRLKTVTETLAALGADITEAQESLVINGKKQLVGGTVSAHGDHRIAMTAAVASTVCSGPVIIKDAEAVNKSYPGFFRDFAALGGNTEEVI
jgi:3-phosphoshikimate 1-carboxyvinyltransferase